MWLTLDRTVKTPLIRQLYLALRQQILQGKLAAGEKLPATRTIATQLHVSRNVVLEAYDQLIAEGYLEGRPGAGTYVAAGATWPAVCQPELSQPELSQPELSQPELSQPELSQLPNASLKADPPVIDFRSGIPALDQFPRKRWGQIARQICLESDPTCFGYGSPAGRLELRTELASYLQRTRGVVCQPDQIVITAGAAQAFGLVVKLVAQPGDWVALEDPGPLEVRQIFRAAGVELQPIPVDQRGLRTEQLRSEQLPISPPRFVLVTPSHQFPLGSVLTIQRRIELLDFARTLGCLIVEDDYDSEFRFEGTPVGAMQGLDPERVIYIGTFSKILSPALRLGYLVLPPAYVPACLRLKWLSDLHNPVLDQLTLARFIQSGQFERHVEQMRQLYRQRRNALRQALRAQFGDQVTISGDSTGLHLIASFAGISFTAPLLQQLQQVKIYPVSAYAADPTPFQQQIILGYGHLSIPEIQAGVAALAQALDVNGFH